MNNIFKVLPGLLAILPIAAQKVVKTNGFKMMNEILTWHTEHKELNALESATE